MLNGKNIWLIGASTGIGEALARQLAAEGASLTLSARDEKKLNALIQGLGSAKHLALPLDVTNDASVALAWEKMTAGRAVPDMVIYNAGAYDPMGAGVFNLEKVVAITEVNFLGSQRIMSRVLPAFLARGSGHIVLVGSVAGYSGLPNAIGYGPSKAALIHFAENLRADLQKTNIRVQLVSPGFVKTRLTEKNSFDMPFIMEPQDAANRIVSGIQGSGFEIAFPKRLYLILKLLRLLPYGIYFRLLKFMKIAG